MIVGNILARVCGDNLAPTLAGTEILSNDTEIHRCAAVLPADRGL